MHIIQQPIINTGGITAEATVLFLLDYTDPTGVPTDVSGGQGWGTKVCVSLRSMYHICMHVW